MKHTFKKLFSVLAAFMMVVGLGLTTVKAEDNTGTITISPANEGQTYDLYRILDATYNETTGATAYTLNEAWNGFATNKAFIKAFTVDAKGNVTPNESFNTDAEAKTFAEAAIAYAKAQNPTIAVVSKTASAPVASATTSTVTFADMPYGYYLVGTSTGSLVSLNTTAPTATIVDKNNVPPFDKKVNETTNNGVGDKVPFEIKVGKTNGVAAKVVVKDTFSEGLSFNDDVVVTINGTLVDSTKYDVDKTDPNYTFKIVFTPEMLKALADGEAVITYTGTVTADALDVDKLTNTATLDFGNKDGADVEAVPVNKPVQIYLQKYTNGTNNNEVNLAGAEFTLTRTDGTHEEKATIAFTKGTGNDANVYTKSANGTVTTLTSSVDGALTLKGLAAGSYTLTETKAPDGYNLLTAPIKFTVSTEEVITLAKGADANSNASLTADNKTVKVLNTTGAQLPSTGGMGTTVLYVAGGLMVAGAAIIMITRKRMSA